MTTERPGMTYSNTVNCYCFNALCDESIFKIPSSAVIQAPLSKVLSQPLHCKSCNSELVAKPLLEMRSQINRSLAGRDKLKAIFIDDDPIFHKMIEHSLKKNVTIDNSKYSLNGSDVIDYLKRNRNKHDQLPDLIFVDINMPDMDGFEFLDELEKLYIELPKKSKVYMTSCNIIPAHKARTKKYRFVKGIISKPFNINTLQNLTEFEFAV
jgi:CheY-like chemotaxis protein